MNSRFRLERAAAAASSYASKRAPSDYFGLAGDPGAVHVQVPLQRPMQSPRSHLAASAGASDFNSVHPDSGSAAGSQAGLGRPQSSAASRDTVRLPEAPELIYLPSGRALIHCPRGPGRRSIITWPILIIFLLFGVRFPAGEPGRLVRIELIRSSNLGDPQRREPRRLPSASAAPRTS